MKKYISTEKSSQFACLFCGSLLYSLSVNVFTLPNRIAPGELTGVSTLINYVTGFPVGTAVILMNLPLFFLRCQGARAGLSFLKPSPPHSFPRRL